MFKYRDSRNRVTSRAGMMECIAIDMVQSEEDLRHGETFRFLPDEDPRITKVAELDNRFLPMRDRINKQGLKDQRFSPTGVTKSGELDRRFRSNRLVEEINGAGLVEVFD